MYVQDERDRKHQNTHASQNAARRPYTKIMEERCAEIVMSVADCDLEL